MKQIEERGGDFAANYEILDDNGRRKTSVRLPAKATFLGPNANTNY